MKDTAEMVERGRAGWVERYKRRRKGEMREEKKRLLFFWGIFFSKKGKKLQKTHNTIQQA